MTIYGIRHHGPGSARRLREALKLQQPDCILIEGAPEGDELLTSLQDPRLLPPVALLIYRPDQPEQAAYYPFAEFSPEWQAMRYGVERGIPVHFMDISPAHLWKLQENKSGEDDPQDRPRRVDWMGQIAREAGYPDGERWWEATVEQQADTAPEMFTALLDLMRAVRQQPEWEATVDEETLLREAYMRREIRKYEKKGYRNLAVVCGAFHAPVLADMPPAKEDNARLKGLKKTKSAATWIPWTYERLSFMSGYGAGVQSPAWYELRFQHPQDELIGRWMTQAARLFRAEGLDASPAHAIEASNLAHALAALRGLAQPRLEEMLEAAQSVMARGDASPMQLVEDALVIGQKMGEVPEGVPELPLQRHVRAEQRRLRLKPKAGTTEVKLDLRKDLHREKSYLIHRLDLLDIKWGHMQESNDRALGTFWEIWQLDWQPEQEMSLIEASFWGNTLEKACAARIKRTLKEQKDLAVVTDLLQRVFLANIASVIPLLVKKLRRLAAVDRDPDHLLDALPALTNVLRYGDVRQLSADQVQPVVDSLAPRLALGLPEACRHLDEEFAKRRWQQLQATHQAMQLLQSRAREGLGTDHGPIWMQALATLADHPSSHSLLAGGALRLLFEAGERSAESTALAMSRVLSPGTPPEQAASWIEGFLHGSGALLIHQPRLWALIDQWVSELPEERFQEALPLLRRTFSQFDSAERRKMSELVRGEIREKEQPSAHSQYDPERAKLVEEVLGRLLGG